MAHARQSNPLSLDDMEVASTSAVQYELMLQGDEQSESTALRDQKEDISCENNTANLTEERQQEVQKEVQEEGQEEGQEEVQEENDGRTDDNTDGEDPSFNPDSEGTSVSGIAESDLSLEHYDRRKARKRYMQHTQHLRITENRLCLLEQKLRIYKESTATSSTGDYATATPELRFLPWAEFKARGSRHLDIYAPHPAIDVLLGDPVLFHQRHKNLGRPTAESLSNEETGNLPLNTIPDRIRINSVPLHEVLKNALRRTFHQTQRPLVILHPYKPLLYAEQDLRDALSGLEKRWEVRSETKATGSEDNVGNKGGDDVVDHEDGEDVSWSSDKPQHELPGWSPLAQTREAMEELRCLLRFVDAIKPLIADIQRIPSSLSSKTDPAKPNRATILFKDLWFIFQPGQYLFNKQGTHKIWRILQVTGGRNYLSTHMRTDEFDSPQMKKISPMLIDCYYLDYDGRSFGPVHHRFRITPFEGPGHITDLEVCPIEHLSNYKDLTATLAKRGAQFFRAAQITHKYFKGRTLVSDPKGDRITAPSSDRLTRGTVYPEDVESPVMVDFDRTLQFNPGWTPDFDYPEFAEQDERETREMSVESHSRESGRGEHCYAAGCCENEHILKDSFWDKKNLEDFLSTQGHLYGPDDNVVVPEDDYVLFPNRVFAYILRSRKWACIPLDCLRDVVKEEGNYNALELVGNHKDIVKGLVQTHFAAKNKEKQSASGKINTENHQGFDLVRAKGKGLIILLHGAPGVGKTSTAECVAEYSGTPLFPITCGDLGVEPIQVEENLEFNFQLAESWGCVLLLDEADVFLTQRGDEDLARNALVSIFLRALEYYSGILFLTTNRVGSIDEAFRSRIHLSLYYPILTDVQTEKIWQGQLDRAHQINPDMIMNKTAIIDWARELFQHQMSTRKVGWNGRQIRNAMKTAVALAEYNSAVSSKGNPYQPKKPVLELRFFQVVASASWEFDAYLVEALSMSTLDYAKAHGLRDDTAYPGNEKLAMPFFSGGPWAASSSSPPQQLPQQQQFPHQQQLPQQHQFSQHQQLPQQQFSQQQTVPQPQQFQGGQAYTQGSYPSQGSSQQPAAPFGNTSGPAQQTQYTHSQPLPGQPHATPNSTNQYPSMPFSADGTATNQMPQQWPRQPQQQLRSLFGPQP